MILENVKGATILQEGQTESSIGMTLDLDSANILMQMLSKNLYSDGIGSAIRETCSNALDSHRRAGLVDEPIVVGINKNSYGTYEFSVEDFGLGLDDEDVKNVISKYGKSTKRGSNIELGMFGLGFKAPLAYTSTFYFVCRKNGIERKYMMYEGEDTNTIDMLYEVNTEHANGVKVIIPIKSTTDYTQFLEKAKEQLAYFENVYFSSGVKNDFKIFRHKDFQYSDLTTDKYVHLCLDNVYYSIDYSKLGISPIEGQFALRFNLTDGIFPTPNREQIRYTKEVKELILNRITSLADYLVQKYNSEMKNTDDVKAVYNHIRNSGSRYVFLGGDDMKVNISGLIKFSNHKIISHPHLNGTKKLDLEKMFNSNLYYILGEYQAKSVMIKGKLKSNPSSYFSVEVPKVIDHQRYSLTKKEFYLCSSELSVKQRKFLLERSAKRNIEIILIKKYKQFRLRGSEYGNNYYSMLDLRNHPKHEWRTLINDFQFLIGKIINDAAKGTVEDAFLNEFKDEFAAYLDFLEKNKKQRAIGIRTKKLVGELHYKVARPLERGYDFSRCKYDAMKMMFENRHKVKGITIFGTEENKDTLSRLYHTLPNAHNVNIVIVTKKDYELLVTNPVHNWMNITEFMKGNNKLYKRLVTAHLIYKLFSENQYLNSGDVLSMFNTRLNEDRRVLKVYKNTYASKSVTIFLESMFENASNNNLFDMSIYSEYLRIKAFAEKFSWMDEIFPNRYYHAYEGEKHNNRKYIVSSLFKYNKHRLNLEHYNIKK
jgi:hypothetical protein